MIPTFRRDINKNVELCFHDFDDKRDRNINIISNDIFNQNYISRLCIGMKLLHVLNSLENSKTDCVLE